MAVAVAALLARGRRAAEALMVDQCAIRRRTGESTDPVSGVVTPTYATIYAGRCRVQQPGTGAQAREESPGEQYALLLRLEVHVPMSVTGIEADDEVVITASEHDPDLVGRVMIVRDLAHKSHATARRLGVQERTS